MAIGPGSRLGPYEVTALIGEGGMGKVYRATDTNLKRSVAIKVLPDSVAADAERLARFQREAEVLASLNHQNIAHIHGLEKSDGTTALVMELVEGPTLADRIAQGPISVDDALPIAKQIAEALEAAHEQGIIHRDLKPANIKLRPDGTVKVLDFGLAKAFHASPAGQPAVTASPTITSPAMMTGVGVLLGTAAYMSPEQARGKPVDKRGDIWAFGCVLYEMLTGRPAFDAAEVSDTLALILTKSVDLDVLPAATPSAVIRLLRRALTKNRRDRLADVSDARLEIVEAIDAAAAGRVDVDATPAVVSRRWLPWIAAGIAAAIALTLSIPALRYMRELRAAAPEVRLELNAPPTVDSVSLALSPDGTHIAFIGTSDGRSRLWVRSLNSTSARPLERTDGASGPFWSPDSRSIAFFAEGALKRIDIAQGSIQILASINGGSSGTWAPDGIIFAGGAASGLSKVSSTGGAVTFVTSVAESEQGHRNPQFLPDGRHFAYYVRGGNDVRGIYVSSLDRLTPRRLLDADTAAPVYFAGNKLLFVRQGTLFEQDFDFTTLTLQGNPAPLVEQVGVDPQFRAAFSVSADGVIAYRAAAASSRRQFVWFDRAGKVLARVGDPDENRAFSPQLSPDGSHVAMHRSVTGNVDIWLLDLRRQVLTRFTSDPANELTPVWSPDGSQIAFGRFRAGTFELSLSTLDGQDHPLGINGTAADWSPDGRFLLVSDLGIALRALSLDTKQLSVVTEQGDRGQFSPDGKWVAYESAESGQFEVYVQSFPKAGPKLRISTSGGAQPRWRRDGRELFYIALDERLMSVPIRTLNGALELLPPIPLFKTAVGGAVQELTSASYMVATDGQRFLMNTLLEDASTNPINFIMKRRGRY